MRCCLGVRDLKLLSVNLSVTCGSGYGQKEHANETGTDPVGQSFCAVRVAFRMYEVVISKSNGSADAAFQFLIHSVAQLLVGFEGCGSILLYLHLYVSCVCLFDFYLSMYILLGIDVN